MSSIQVQSNASGSGAIILASPNTNNINTLTLPAANATFLSSASAVVTSATNGLGYGTGVGGTVTQLTSKSTGVTLNTLSGKITMNNATMNPSAAVSFVLSNSLIGINDTLSVSICWDGVVDPSNYTVSAGIYQVAAGSAYITLVNRSGGTLSQAVQLNFNIIRGASA
jgi:hypothetical protein